MVDKSPIIGYNIINGVLCVREILNGKGKRKKSHTPVLV